MGTACCGLDERLTKLCSQPPAAPKRIFHRTPGLSLQIKLAFASGGDLILVRP